MSIRSVLGIDPLAVALAAVRSDEDKLRRGQAARRISYYLDNPIPSLRLRVDEMFADPTVRQRIKSFLSFGVAQSVLKRIVDEISRPVYSPPPLRRIRDGSIADVANHRRIIGETRHNAKMDLACRLTNACNVCWVFCRFVPRLGVVEEILTPNQVSIIVDPDDPTRELALAYDQFVIRDGKRQIAYTYWDDEETFRFLESGEMIPLAPGEYRRAHGLGRLPFIAIHRRERWGAYFDETSGNDLVAAAETICLLHALVLKLHKDQGEKAIVVSSEDTSQLPKGQTLDGGTALVYPAGTSVVALDLVTDPGHYLRTIDATLRTVAANYGLSIDRINSKAGVIGDEWALMERRAETIKTFEDAEQRTFELHRTISRETGYPISDAATLEVDFAEISAKGDRKTVLEVWQQEIRMGLRNLLDCVREDNPEIDDDDAAMREVVNNAGVRAQVVELLRALNISTNDDFASAGRTAIQNGAMGAATRDAPAENTQSTEGI